MKNIVKRNNVRVIGAGKRAMVFVHGYGCDQNMWRRVTPAFQEKYQIVLLDLVGAGNSDLKAFEPVRYSTLHGYAEDIIEVCDALSLTEVIFVGHSVSAMICGLAQIKRPDLFAGLVMVGPSPCYVNKEDYVGGFNQEDLEELIEMIDSNYLGWSKSMAPAIMGNPEEPALGEELTESFCQTDPAIAGHFAKTTFFSDNRKDLPRITSPTLVLQCSQDIIAPDSVGKYVSEKIEGSKFVQLEATGHCPHMSSPKELIAEVKDWMQQESLS